MSNQDISGISTDILISSDGAIVSEPSEKTETLMNISSLFSQVKIWAIFLIKELHTPGTDPEINQGGWLAWFFIYV